MIDLDDFYKQLMFGTKQKLDENAAIAIKTSKPKLRVLPSKKEMKKAKRVKKSTSDISGKLIGHV